MSAPDQTTVTPEWDQPEAFRLQEEPIEGVGVAFTVSGELDIATAPDLRKRLTRAIERGARGLVIDLTAVSFMDSVAMAAIIQARTQLHD